MAASKPTCTLSPTQAPSPSASVTPTRSSPAQPCLRPGSRPMPQATPYPIHYILIDVDGGFPGVAPLTHRRGYSHRCDRLPGKRQRHRLQRVQRRRRLAGDAGTCKTACLSSRWSNRSGSPTLTQKARNSTTKGKTRKRQPPCSQPNSLTPPTPRSPRSSVTLAPHPPGAGHHPAGVPVRLCRRSHCGHGPATLTRKQPVAPLATYHQINPATYRWQRN